LILTDESNPTFYFSKLINDLEFDKLREDQWVLVDIGQVPEKLNSLLQLCS